MNEMVLERCEEMIKKGSTSFYHAFYGLPSPRREAVFVIYAFCRMIDDSVDEPEHSPYSIYELREHLLDIQKAEGHFIWPALRWLFGTFPALTKAPFLRQIEGQLTDLTLTRYTTVQELERYCYLVAGTVGEMLLPVLRDDSGPQTIESGIALGKAMQIVNIIRDVGEDQRRGRRYLPLDMMTAHGYTEEDFDKGVIDNRFISLITELRQMALHWFRIGLSDVGTYPEDSGLAVELAASFYSAILQAVEHNHYDVFTQRAYVNDEAKVRLFLEISSKYPALLREGMKAAVS